MDIIYRGKVKDMNTGYHEMDLAYGDLIRELQTGKYFICDLSHFDNKTLLKDVLIEVEKDTVELVNNKEKPNMKCKLKLKYGLGGATIHNVTDYYSDNDGNYVIKQGDSEIKIKEDMIYKVVVNKLY